MSDFSVFDYCNFLEFEESNESSLLFFNEPNISECIANLIDNEPIDDFMDVDEEFINMNLDLGPTDDFDVTYEIDPLEIDNCDLSDDIITGEEIENLFFNDVSPEIKTISPMSTLCNSSVATSRSSVIPESKFTFFSLTDKNDVSNSHNFVSQFSILMESPSTSDSLPNNIPEKTNNLEKCSTKTIKRSKRARPEFKISVELLERIAKYWTVIATNSKYMTLLKTAREKAEQLGIKELNHTQFTNNVVPALLPNYVDITFFKNLQGEDGWNYEKNTKRHQPSVSLALRWCGQELNFYDPFVVRYKIDDKGKRYNKQAMCPYCPVYSGLDLDIIFHTTQDSLYMHHVCKDHGVYSTGYEVSPPLIGLKDSNIVAYCTECDEICKIGYVGSGIDNCLIGYFRHAFVSHNRKRQKRTREQRHSDHTFFNGCRKRFVFENDTSLSAANFIS